MKDLTDKKAFSQVKLFNNVIKRKVDINQYDDFLADLRKQKAEAERGDDVDMSLGSYKDQLQNEHFNRNQIMNDNYDDAIKKIANDFNSEETQETQGWDNSFGDNENMSTAQNNIVKRITIDLKNNLESYFQEQDAFYQDKNKQVERLMKKRKLLSEWNGLLYSSRILSGIALGSVVNLLVAIPRFKIFPIELLVVSIAKLLVDNNKLRKFHDGLFCGNPLFKTDKIKPLVSKNYKELILADKETQDEESQEEENRTISMTENNQGSNDFDFDSFDSNDNDDGFNFDDDDDAFGGFSGGLSGGLTGGLLDGSNDKRGGLFDDDEPETQAQVEDNQSHYVAKPTLKSRSNSDFLAQLNLNTNEVITQDNIAPSYISFKNKEYHSHDFHEQALDYLNSLYANRKELGKQAKTREDFCRIFAPIIAKFNDDFGQKTEIDFNDNVVNNLTFALFLTFSEINNRYRNISKQDFNPDYYLFVGNATKTALYYKIDFKLPSIITISEFQKNLHVLNRYLKKTNSDKAVQLSIETNENGGSLKVFRVKTNSEGTILLPPVSSGDILRFKGMNAGKAKDGHERSLLEVMTGAGDFNSMIGVREGEYPVIQDFGASSNSNLFICADTGAGKTIAMKSILENSLWVYSPDEVGFLIFDIKSGQDWKQFRYLPHVLGYFGEDEFENYTDILQTVKAVNSARHEYMNDTVRSGMADYAKTRIKYSKNGNWEKLMTVPHLFVILDEQLDLLQELDELDVTNKMKNSNRDKDEEKLSVDNKRRYKASVGGMANKFREQGISFIFISQKADDEAIPRKAMLSASMSFFMLGNDNEIHRKYSSTTHSTENLPVGTGYFFARGKYPNGVKVNVSLTSGSPDASLEYTRLLAIAWNILQANRGVDMFKENVGFCTEEVERKNHDMPRVVNRPTALVEIAKELYNGRIFITDDDKIHQSINIVDDILENITEDSKRRFPKEYQQLLAIKDPQLAKQEQQKAQEKQTETVEEQKPQLNDYQKQLQDAYRKQIEDDSDNFADTNLGADVPADDATFTEDEVNDQIGIMEDASYIDDEIDKMNQGMQNDNSTLEDNNFFGNASSEKETKPTIKKVSPLDDEENISDNEVTNDEKQDEKPKVKVSSLEEVLNGEDDTDEEDENDNKEDNETVIKDDTNEENNADEQLNSEETAEKQTTKIADNHIELHDEDKLPNIKKESVSKQNRLIDDGTNDMPQTIYSIQKYCRVHHLQEVSITELNKHFSENAINSAFEQGILMRHTMKKDTAIFLE